MIDSLGMKFLGETWHFGRRVTHENKNMIDRDEIFGGRRGPLVEESAIKFGSDPDANVGSFLEFRTPHLGPDHLKNLMSDFLHKCGFYFSRIFYHDNMISFVNTNSSNGNN